MSKNTSLSQRVKENWASLGAMLTALLGIILFAVLISGSFESTETPAAVISMAAVCGFLSAVCFFWKDLLHALSVAAFFTSLGALGAFVAGRVSYLAFFLSGDVMGTGLSPLFILSAVLLVLAVIFSALSMAQPFDAHGRAKAGKYLILAVAAVAVIAVVAVAVINAILGASAPGGKNPSGTNPPAVTTQQPGGEATPTPAAKYKTPTQEASHWQGMTKEELAAEDVSGRAIAYQFAGHMDGDRAVDLLVNLYEDGFVRIYQVSNGALTYSYNGYWRNKDDESLYFGVSNYAYQGEDNPGYGVMHGDTATVDYSYDLMEQGGKFSFGCNFCLGFAEGGQFVRSTIIEGDGAVQYATAEEFLAAVGAAPVETPAPTEEPADGGDEKTYPENTLVLTFIPDTSDQLKTEFWAESGVWGVAFGGAGDYTPTDSSDVLFSWSNTAQSFQLDFKADGTFEYRFTTMGIVESGTWTWSGWTLTTTTAKGVTATGEITK